MFWFFKKKIAIALSAFLALIMVSGAQAGVRTTSFIDITDFVIKGSDGNRLDAAADFASLTYVSSADQDVTFDGQTAGDTEPGSITDIDFPVICIGTCP